MNKLPIQVAERRRLGLRQVRNVVKNKDMGDFFKVKF